MAKLWSLVLLAVLIHSTRAILRKSLFPDPVQVDPSDGDVGEPLFLTPYIESGKLEEARNLSRVTGLPDAPETVVSYSGYLTVNKEYNSNTFFWFFPCQTNPSAPVLLWLQGGPGGSSMFGLFNEHGPLQISAQLKATLRKYAWTESFSMLYIDNPVGTGFSFTDKDEGYARNQTQVATDLYEALQQFFTLYSDFRQNDFYVTGESYAGKYVPAIGFKLHEERNVSRINFKGVAIGDGLCDPQSMFSYADYLYQIGLLDSFEAKYMSDEEDKAVALIKDGKYFEAFKIFDALLNGDTIEEPSFFTNVTGLTYYFNFLQTNSPVEFGRYPRYLALAATRKAIHVGNLTFNDGSIVEHHLLEDMMQSVKPWVTVLMDNYRFLMYSGQLDIIVAAPLTENFLRTVEWKHSDELFKAPKTVWKVEGGDIEVAGYHRRVADFHHVIVRRAGHILPFDQPRVAFNMINNFIFDKF
jgi:vitellogenic carboxypeptidase-like protein